MSAADTTKDVPTLESRGAVAAFDLGISAEDFDLIKTNQDLYCLYETEGKVLKISRTLLTAYVGDLLITQGGLYVGQPELFIIHWDGTQFLRRLIPLDYYSQNTYTSPELEQSTFAPIGLPILSQMQMPALPLIGNPPVP